MNVVRILVLVVCSLALGAVARDLPDDTVIYGVVPTLLDAERPLLGVLEHLDELSALGVTVLWLSPINTSDDPSHISYAVTDYRGLRADFGTPGDLKKLVSEAHAEGFKVILDFVANHTSDQHPWYRDMEAKGDASAFAGFYQRDRKGNSVHYFDWENLPNLDFDNSRVADEIFGAMKFWIEEYGIDGFRMDAIWGVRDRSPSALRELIDRLVKLKPDIVLIAEAGARDGFYFRSGFQSAYDWSESLGEWAWSGEFEKTVPDARALIREAGKGVEPRKVLRFLNNNDTGERFITKYGLGRTVVAAVFQFTVPGIPLVYSGDEIGAEFEPYEDPEPLVWADAHGLRSFYQELIRLRKSLPALRAGSMVPLETTGGPGVGAFLRRVNDTEWAVVALNFGSEGEFALSLPQSVSIPTGSLWDALGQRSVPVSGENKVWLRLPENGSAILLPEAPKLESRGDSFNRHAR